MKVFKFGGASVKDAASVRNVVNIISQQNQNDLLIIVSAMGKMTNALESILNGYINDSNGKKESLQGFLFYHQQIIEDLFPANEVDFSDVYSKIKMIPTIIAEHQDKGYDFVYDQVVSLGEWLSTNIVSNYLTWIGIENRWLEAKDFIKTDNTYRDSRVDWEQTSRACKDIPNGKIIITQGFTGGSEEGFTTTLGREGSDYSAAIFSYCLNAESMTVWKDVPGILNADPRKFDNVTKLDKISYREAIEMTYYGAKVIHPKTIKPLQNKNIPLYVNSFVQPEKQGTIISKLEEENYPPIVVLEPDQVLLHISTRDFSFVAEHHLSNLFAQFAEHRIKVNMMRNTAISFYVCVSHKEDILPQLIDNLQKDFNIECKESLELITVRYHTPQIIENLKRGNLVMLEEKLKNTMQMVVKAIALPQRKESQVLESGDSIEKNINSIIRKK